jgi:Sigma-70 region 2
MLGSLADADDALQETLLRAWRGLGRFEGRSSLRSWLYTTEGLMRMAYPGRTLVARGVEVDDPDACYLYEARMAVLWPMDDNGRVRGEDTYTSGDGFARIADRKLRPEDILELTDTR